MEKLIQINISENHAYFIYSLEVQRGIRGKTKGRVGEVLIFGCNTKHLQDWCVEHNLVITNKAVYSSDDLNHPILVREGEGLNYVIKSSWSSVRLWLLNQFR